jgi:hypothetical protein
MARYSYRNSENYDDVAILNKVATQLKAIETFIEVEEEFPYVASKEECDEIIG